MCNGTPFTVEKSSPRAGLEPGSARSVGQRLTHRATGAPWFQRRRRKKMLTSDNLSNFEHRSKKDLSVEQNSVEHEILNAHRYKNIKKFSFLQTQISRECFFSVHKC